MIPSYCTAAIAALLSASAVADQFVMYAAGGDTDSVQRIDPIISPGTISGHVHQVFGSSSVRSDMTYDSLQSTSCTSVGSAGGKGNAADNSVYWHPALYAQARDGSGLIRIPTNGHKLYYQDTTNSQDQRANPFQFKQGMRIVAGDAYRRTANSDIHKQNITQWICHSKNGQNQGTDGGFPDNVSDCDAYPFFNGAITFPSCWSGADFDPANVTAHMSYPDGDVSAGPCPPSHPIRVPKIFIENQFDLHSVVDKIKPNTFVLANGDPTGYGWHADFFNGWQDGAIPTLLASCPPAKYGNQDAGGCSAFKAGSATDQCKLPVEYVENVDTPGSLLPGCNPITSSGTAPKLAVAALGSNTCADGSGGNDGTGGAGGEPSSVTQTTTSTSATVAQDPSETPSAVQTTIYSLPSAFGGLSTFTTMTRTQAQALAYSPAATGHSADSAASTAHAAPASQATGSLCPASNGQTYTSNGKAFTIECGVDHVAGDMGMRRVVGLADCIDKCAQTSGCVDVSLSGTACYLKKSLGAAENNSGVNGAKLVSATNAAAQAAPTNYAGHGNDRLANPAADEVTVTQVETVTAQITTYAHV